MGQLRQGATAKDAICEMKKSAKGSQRTASESPTPFRVIHARCMAGQAVLKQVRFEDIAG